MLVRNLLLIGLAFGFTSVAMASGNTITESRKIEFKDPNGKVVMVDRNNVCVDSKNNIRTMDEINYCNETKLEGSASERNFVCTEVLKKRLKTAVNYQKSVCAQFEGTGANRSCVATKTVKDEIPLTVSRNIYAKVGDSNTRGGDKKIVNVENHTIPSCPQYVVED